jgi:hypothetical protein
LTAQILDAIIFLAQPNPRNRHECMQDGSDSVGSSLLPDKL